MNDAIALIAVSQLVCLGAIAYLYMQLQGLRAKVATRRSAPRPPAAEPGAPATAVRAARSAYGSRATARPDTAALAARMNELGVDVPALARRLRKSEDEVRLLLRRQGAPR